MKFYEVLNKAFSIERNRHVVLSMSNEENPLYYLDVESLIPGNLKEQIVFLKEDSDIFLQVYLYSCAGADVLSIASKDESFLYYLVDKYKLKVDFSVYENYESTYYRKYGSLHYKKFEGSKEYADAQLQRSVNGWIRKEKDHIRIEQINAYPADSGGYNCYIEVFYYDLQEGE